MRILLLLIAVTFGCTIGYSRLILGMHSLNQIIFGLLLGIWVALTCHYSFYDRLLNHALDLLESRFFDSNQSARKNKFLKVSAITLAVFILLEGI